MASSPERTSPVARARWPALLALALSVTPIARAAPPENAWGTGIDLPGTEGQGGHYVALLPDGPAGLLAITWRFYAGLGGYNGAVRLYRVLEQGRLDPSLPPDGATIISSADLPDAPAIYVVRAVGDDAGGVYVLVRACDPLQPHLRCYEVAETRLLHVTSQGLTASGWPALGYVLATSISPDLRGAADIASDGEGGVIAVWLEGFPNAQAPAVLAQRFSPGGIPLWPGGLTGQVVLAQRGARGDLRVAGDLAGGVAVVVGEVLPGMTRFDAYAGRMDAAGNNVWGTAGKTVFVQPGYSASPQALAVDGSGRALVGAVMTLASGTDPREYMTQMLTATGGKSWSMFGVTLGSYSYEDTFEDTPAALTPEGFVTVHRDVAGDYRVQSQDEFGHPQWGDSPAGLVSSWASPPRLQFPVSTGDGHVICVWDAGGDPATSIRALELDESGAPLPDWPDTGAVVCCGDPLPPVCCGENAHHVGDAIASGGQLFVAFGTSDYTTVPVRIQRLSRAVLAVEPQRPRAALLLSPPSPNPSREAWSLRFELAEASAVTLEVLDIAGRRMLREDLGGLAAGPHAVPVPRSASLAPGVYRLRLKAGVHTAERMLVRAR